MIDTDYNPPPTTPRTLDEFAGCYQARSLFWCVRAALSGLTLGLPKASLCVASLFSSWRCVCWGCPSGRCLLLGGELVWALRAFAGLCCGVYPERCSEATSLAYQLAAALTPEADQEDQPRQLPRVSSPVRDPLVFTHKATPKAFDSQLPARG